MWASTFLAIINAIPAAQKLFNQILELYYTEMDRRLEEDSSRVLKEREALVASLRLEGLTAEQRSIIRRRLHELQY